MNQHLIKLNSMEKELVDSLTLKYAEIKKEEEKLLRIRCDIECLRIQIESND